MTYRKALATLCISASITGCGPKQSDANHHTVTRSQFESIKDPPINSDTHFATGQLAESENAPDRALDEYKKANAGKNAHLPSLYRMAVVYAQLKKYPEAIDAWTKYVKLTDGSAAAYSNLGFCHELAGDPAAAEAAYLKGIRKDPNSEPCHVNYGFMLARHGRTGEAMLQLQSVLPPAKAHYNLASVFEMKGDKAQARAEYQKAMELDPTLREAQARLDALN